MPEADRTKKGEPRLDRKTLDTVVKKVLAYRPPGSKVNQKSTAGR